MADPPRADLPSCPADPAKKRKRRLRIALAALALLIVSAAAAAPIGSRIARGQLESRIEEMLAVELELESLALDLSGSLGLSGLTIVDLDQRPLLSLERLDANVGVLGALFGSLDVEAHMRGLELHVYVDERGQLREPKLVREEWKRARAEAAAQDDEPAGGVPDIKLLFDLEDARVVVHTPEGETRLEGIALSLERPEGDGPLAFELGANLYGPDGAGGALRSTGTLSAPTEEGALPIGSVESILEELQLAALAPILRSYSEIESLSGQLNGSARIEFKDSEHGVASFGLSALDVASQGPWSPEAAHQAGDFQADGELSFFSAGELEGEFSFSGEEGMRAGGQLSWRDTVSGEVSFQGQNPACFELVRPFLPLRPELSYEGRLLATLSLTGARDAEGALTALSVTGSSNVQGFAATNESGARVGAGPLTRQSSEFELHYDADAGRVELSRLASELGSADADGLPARLAGSAVLERLAPALVASGAPPWFVERAELSGSLDLARLGPAVQRMFDLPESEFSGRLAGQLSATPGTNGLALAGEYQAIDFALDAGGVLGVGPLAAEGTLAGDASVDASEVALSWSNSVRGLGETQRIVQMASGLVRAGALESTGRLTRVDGGAWELGVQNSAGGLAYEVGAEGVVVVELADAQSSLDLRYGPDQALFVDASSDARLSFGGSLVGGGFIEQELRIETNAAGTRTIELDGHLRQLALGLEADAIGPPVTRQLTLRLLHDVPAGVLTITQLELAGGGQSSSVSGELRGLVADELTVGAVDISGRLVLAEAGSWMAPLLGLDSLTGEPLEQSARIELTDEGILVTALLSAPRIAAVRAPAIEGGAPRAGQLRELRSELSAGLARAGGADPRPLEFSMRSPYGELTAKGAHASLFMAPWGELALELAGSGSVAPLANDLGPLLGLVDASGGGDWTLGGTIRGRGYDFEVESRFEGTQLSLDVPTPSDEPELAAVALDEAEVFCFLSARVARDEGRLELTSLSLDSTTLEAGLGGAFTLPPEGGMVFEELRGELAYIPDRLQLALGRWIPGELSGSDREFATLALDGSSDSLDALSILRTCEGDSRVGLGRWSMLGFDTEGQLVLDISEGHARSTGDLSANGGTITLDLDVDLREQEGEGGPIVSRISTNMQGVRAGGESSWLLAAVHPAFAGATQLVGDTGVQGLISGAVELSYTGALDAEQLAGGWGTWPKENFDGSASLELSEAGIAANALMQEMLALIGVGRDERFSPSPMAFVIERGIVRYANPWTWTIAEIETNFTGGVNMDGGLDLAWNLPIGSGLVAREPLLRYLEGESISIPLRGTLTAPRLELSSMLPSLLRSAARAQLRGALGGGAGDSGSTLGGALDAVLGGGDGGGLGGVLGGIFGGNRHDENQPAEPAAPRNASSILREANRLWAAGDLDGARPLYQELRRDYGGSRPYINNRNRIEERADS